MLTIVTSLNRKIKLIASTKTNSVISPFFLQWMISHGFLLMNSIYSLMLRNSSFPYFQAITMNAIKTVPIPTAFLFN